MVTNLNCSAIVQARSGSTRLPGKIFKQISGKPMLQHVIERLSYSKLINQIIVATTTLPDDDAVEDFCKMNKITFHRGSPDDVLSRYYDTAKRFSVDTIVRVTSDCPLIDPQVIDKMIEKFFLISKSDHVDYLSNSIVRTFPRGLDAEVFSFAALEQAHNESEEVYEREHVTPFIYHHPEKFIHSDFLNNKDYSFHRWTVDTEEDFRLVSEIYSELYKPNSIFYLDDVLKLFEKRHDLLSINQNIKQKSLGE